MALHRVLTNHMFDALGKVELSRKGCLFRPTHVTPELIAKFEERGACTQM